MTIAPKNPQLTGFTLDELTHYCQEREHKAYRAKQILEWVWRKKQLDVTQMTNLPPALIADLQQVMPQPLTHIQTQGSADTTQKFLFQLHDGHFVESVLIPANIGKTKQSSRLTACISSQVGCAFGCKFCASGLEGFERNLTAGEITAQLFLLEQISGKKIENIVFMGMGEPLANLPNLTRALDIITEPWGLYVGARHITVSTSGLAPKIEQLAHYPKPIRLAISFHAPTDDSRNIIMPVNKKWGVERLFQALHYWQQHKKQKITLEYILISNVNDSFQLARILAKKARSINAKVNLIPYNTVDGLSWQRPLDVHCYNFRDILIEQGVFTTLRIEKGHDIDAACGQLRLKKKNSL